MKHSRFLWFFWFLLLACGDIGGDIEALVGGTDSVLKESSCLVVEDAQMRLLTRQAVEEWDPPIPTTVFDEEGTAEGCPNSMGWGNYEEIGQPIIRYTPVVVSESTQTGRQTRVLFNEERDYWDSVADPTILQEADAGGACEGQHDLLTLVRRATGILFGLEGAYTPLMSEKIPLCVRFPVTDADRRILDAIY